MSIERIRKYRTEIEAKEADLMTAVDALEAERAREAAGRDEAMGLLATATAERDQARAALATCQAALVECRAGEPPPPPPGPSVDAEIEPSMSASEITSLVASRPEGAEFLIHAGRYPDWIVEQKDDQAFWGEPGAVLDGGGVPGRHPFGKSDHLQLLALLPDDFDPRTAPTEVRQTMPLVTGYPAADVQEYAIDQRRGPVGLRIDGWSCRDMWAPFYKCGGSHGTRLWIADCGYIALGNSPHVAADGSVVPGILEDSLIERVNLPRADGQAPLQAARVAKNTVDAERIAKYGLDPATEGMLIAGYGFEASVFKHAATHTGPNIWTSIVRRTTVRTVLGTGVWADGGNGTLVEDSDLDLIDRGAVTCEVAKHFLATRCRITRSGFAVRAAESSDVEFSDCEIADCPVVLFVRQGRGRFADGKILDDVRFLRNRVLDSGVEGVVRMSAGAYSEEEMIAHITCDDNDYRLSADARWLNRTWDEWRATGQDAHSTLEAP